MRLLDYEKNKFELFDLSKDTVDLALFSGGFLSVGEGTEVLITFNDELDLFEINKGHYGYSLSKENVNLKGLREILDSWGAGEASKHFEVKKIVDFFRSFEDLVIPLETLEMYRVDFPKRVETLKSKELRRQTFHDLCSISQYFGASGVTKISKAYLEEGLFTDETIAELIKSDSLWSRQVVSVLQFEKLKALKVAL